MFSHKRSSVPHLVFISDRNMHETINEDENYKTVLRDLTKTFDKAQADFTLNLANALKLWGIKRR